MILVCANIKGGPGKSCMAQNAAVYLQKEKGMKVLLVDGDPQETTADWIAERREEGKLPDIRFSKMTGKVRDDLIESEKHYDAIVVDCGGHDSVTMREAMAAATHALIPFRAKRRDLKLLPRMEEITGLVRAVNPDIVVRSVINQAPTLPSQAYRIADAKEACKSYGIPPLKNVIANRNIYDDADESGSSIFEFQPSDKKATNEFTTTMTELLEG